ncbi:SPL family radical SAM protein [Terriglobus albidus]|uniref:SPL family radical SAM protein n=1 Tax=Terriglobus albidus TaxID=1592106 RepID=UPI0021E0F6E9|nr:radical SAM protein [Terriglobus albidus]
MNGEEKAKTLFPILPSATGMVRMAAQAEHVDDGHDVEFCGMKVSGILNRSVSKRMHWMAWSINPYRGCEFGCRYCYARYTHEFLAPKDGPAEGQPDFHDPEIFERKIFVKENAAWLLEQELRRLERQGHITDEIALGTATDPWQPIERRQKVTRSLLEVLARRSGIRLGIVTKSTLILRDLDLLQEIARKSVLVVHLTITTPDVELARKLEPRAPRPDLRLATLQKLRQAGIIVGVLNSPLLPGITDTMTAIDRIAKLSADHGACFFAANPLFLKPCSRPTYLSFVHEHFPDLEPEYARRFQDRDFADKAYATRLSAMVSAICRKHGLNKRAMDSLLSQETAQKIPSAAVREPVQRQLFG